MSAPPPPPDPRPGCYDRAWNDPPLFSYQNSESAAASATNTATKFNKRVGFPTGMPPPPTSAASNAPPISTLPLSAPPPPPTNLPPPPMASGVAPSPSSIPPPAASDVSPAAVHHVPQADEVVAMLTACLDQYKLEIGDKKSTDIGKRVAVMSEKWEAASSLNDHIKAGMVALATNLQEREFDKAEKIQKTLMVDWPSQCGTWMVGIRHLIQEAKKAHLARNPSSAADQANSKCDEQKGYFIPVAQKMDDLKLSN